MRSSNSRVRQTAPLTGQISLQRGAMLAEIQKGPTERLRVSVTSYRGREYIDVRVFYLDRSSEYQASRQGMTLRPALALQLIQALGLAVRSIDPKGAN